jgi:hypothetical protein
MKLKSIILSAIALVILSSCKDDEPDTPLVPNDEEVITTLTYTLTNATDTAVFQYTDLDGDGGNPPVITVDTLQANQAYSGVISLLNQLDTPTLNVTEEVSEEGTEHQLFYTPSTDYLVITYTDSDADGYPIGITTDLSTSDAATGTLTIVLRHEPNKEAPGVEEGNITNAEGTTDIEVVFNVVVE